MSGSGIGTPFVPPVILPAISTDSNYPIFGNDFMPLVRYAKMIGYHEGAFFGFSIPQEYRMSCRQVWTKDQRDDIQFYLEEAQDEIEQVINYTLEKKWNQNEGHPFAKKVLSNWSKVIEVGIRAEEEISSGAGINYALDPNIAQIIIAIDYTNKSLYDLHVYYPDTDIEITPSNITYSAGTLTIYIPRTRLLAYTLLDNTIEGVLYSDSASFQPTADVKRIYTDSSVQGKLYYRGDICSSFCTEEYDDACMYLKNPDIGSILIEMPAISGCGCRNYERMELNYAAGLTSTTKVAEMTVIRLAHSKMPTEPCGCDVTQRLWKRDRTEPQILDRERLNCPFGLSNGAWSAWKFATSMAVFRMSEL